MDFAKIDALGDVLIYRVGPVTHPVWPKGLSTLDAYASRHGMDPFRQFVKLSVIAWFRPHYALRVRHGEHVTLGDGCVNFCKVHVRSDQN